MRRMSSLASFLNLSPAAWSFLREEVSGRKASVLMNFFGGVVTAFLEITGIGLVFPLLAVIMNPDSLDHVPKVKYFFDYLGIDTQKELTLFLAAAIAIVMVIKAGYMIGFYRWQFQMVASWKADVSRRMMRLYVMSDFKMHMERSPSEMIRNLSVTGVAFDQYIIAGLNVMIYLTVAAGIGGLLLVALPYETAFALVTMFGAAFVIFKITKKHISSIGEENNELYRLRMLCLNQSIGAIRESKILGKERHFLDAFSHLEWRTFDRQGHYNFLASFPGLIMESVIIVSMLAVVVNVIFIVGGGVEGLAIVGLLTAAMFRMLPMVIRTMSNMQLLNLGKPSFELIASEIDECEHRVYETHVGEDDRYDGWKELEFRNIGYTYPDGTVALNKINATITRNDFVGITGPSGSGKTTLLMILLGLIEPTEGEMILDGTPLSGPDALRRWQNGIGYVPQGLFIIDGSIADNVAFGDANPDLERVQEAAEMAQLGEYLREQPDGVLDQVGEYGALLSGGQKQRVVIARALYRDPDLIAFDEATAALDVESERGLTDYLATFKSEKTMLAIAHRITTIKHCDKILYLEAGRLGGFAPFDELKRDSQGFANLAALSNL
ncbi:MAG: ABC transporter ATP-binding protein [Betaproteobacteria bacterium]|jgi:ATP-binding cassette, subfamily B, bacterial PglK|nr:ABC transporter ATP-binding protein [Betaproteobacteria bacterium]